MAKKCPKKRQSLNARLQKALRIRELLAQYPSGKYRPLPFVPTGLSGPSRADIWNATARQALRLTDGDRTTKKAFDTFGLDPNDPWHWRELVEELVTIIFKRKHPGRHKEWSSERIEELLSAVEAKQQRNPRISDVQACNQLAGAEDSPQHYRKAGTGGLLKQLQFARRKRAAAASKDRTDRGS